MISVAHILNVGKKFLLLGLAMLFVGMLGACHNGGGSGSGGAGSSGDDSGELAKPTSLLPEGVTEACFLIHGNGLMIVLNVKNAHAQGDVWTADVSGTLCFSSSNEDVQSIRDKELTLVPGRLERDVSGGTDGIRLTLTPDTDILSNDGARLELKSMHIEVGNGDDTRVGTVISLGDASISYKSAANNYETEWVDIPEQYIEAANITLSDFIRPAN